MGKRLVKSWVLNFTTDDNKEWFGVLKTYADKEKDFPKSISGQFWTEKIKEVGTYGLFKLDNRISGIFSVNKMFELKDLQKYSSVDEIIKNINEIPVIDEWKRFDMKIEDCLVFDVSTIDEC